MKRVWGLVIFCLIFSLYAQEKGSTLDQKKGPYSIAPLKEDIKKNSSDLKCYVKKDQSDSTWLFLNIIWLNKDLNFKITLFSDKNHNLNYLDMSNMTLLRPLSELLISAQIIDPKKSVVISIKGAVLNREGEYLREVSCHLVIPRQLKIP